MSEFQSDIEKKYDEEGHELDKHGFRIKKLPDGLESVRRAVKNCEQMCGLDRKVMERLIKGTYGEYSTLDHRGRTSQKIVIEYDITDKKEDV